MYILPYLYAAETSKPPTRAKVPKGKWLWNKLKGSLSKFNKKSQTRINIASSVLPPGNFNADVNKMKKLSSKGNFTKDLLSTSKQLDNNVKVDAAIKTPNATTEDGLPVIQIHLSSELNSDPRKGDLSNKSFDSPSVTVHSSPDMGDYHQNPSCLHKNHGEVVSETLVAQGTKDF